MGWVEEERLRVLRDHGVLDTPAEESFDEIVRAAVQAFGVPMAAVSLVDRNRQWFKARVGLGATETPRDVSFCAHAIQRDDVMVVPDATRDPRFADNALVTNDPSIRFYAGAPILSEEGVPLGALCVVDTAPRADGLTPAQIDLLRTLADQVSEQLRLRRLVRRQAGLIEAGQGREERLVRALQSGAVGWWEWDVATDMVTGNAELARDFGLDPKVASDGAPIAQFFATVHPLDRDHLTHAVRDAVASGDPFREEYRLMNADGRVTWVSARGRCLRDAAGKPAIFPGVIIDISDRKAAEQRSRDADNGRELAMSAARLGSWDHNPMTGERRYDARAAEMMGLDPADVHNVENSYAVIHPDDHDRIRQANAAVMDRNRRGLFREEFRVIDRKDGAIRWLSAVGRTEFQSDICTRFIGVIRDITDERAAEEHRRLLTNELDHRAKNLLAVVAGIVDATIRTAPDLATARRDAGNRLSSLGRAHDLLTAESWVSAEVTAVVRGTIEAVSLPADRLDMDGPLVRLGPKAALQLALALHELATNSVKYGALSNDTGRIRIGWAVEGEGDAAQFVFRWEERGGPPVSAPSRRGFGSRLIEAATAAEFQGSSKIAFDPAGVRWELRAPLAGIDRGR